LVGVLPVEHGGQQQAIQNFLPGNGLPGQVAFVDYALSAEDFGPAGHALALIFHDCDGDTAIVAASRTEYMPKRSYQVLCVEVSFSVKGLRYFDR
jgi:hypothetical protein